MNRFADKHFYETFLLALVIVLLPSKSLGYIVPFICLGWYMVRSQSGKLFKKIIFTTIIFFLVVIFYLLLYSSIGVDYLVSNSVVSLITYGSFIFILLINGPFISTEYAYEKYARILSYTVLIQGTVGIFQFLMVTLTNRFNIIAGDAVQGTIGLFAFVSEEAGFGNQMFAINMVFFLVFLIPNILIHRRGIVSFLIGLIALMMAGVLHVFIGLIFSMLVTLFFFRRNLLFSNIGRLLSALVLAGLLILPLGIIFPGVFDTANVFIKIYQNQDSPKFEIIGQTVKEMPEKYPHVYLVGLGPGQYVSRAGLMSSGKYFERDVPFFSNTVAEPLKEYAYKIWDFYSSNNSRFGNSTMHRPYFSLLSIFAEFGLICFFALLIYLITLLAKMRKAYLFYRREGQYQSAYLSFGVGLLLIFILSISFFDNYLETTQAIFPGLLLVSAFYKTLLLNTSEPLPDKVGHKHLQLSRA
ncbi:MAG: hypothetical protein RIG62_32440 [Cyclobacteriaceae bacterium]